MKKFIKILFLPILVLSLFWGCANTADPVRDARKMVIDEVTGIPGFTWFGIEYDIYQPDSLTVEQIKKAFNPTIHKILYFVKPACTCEIPQQPFPHIVKTMRLANINDSLSELFSMVNTSDNNPYSHKLPLSKLPTIYIMKMNDTIPVYSVMDTIEHAKQINKDTVFEVEKMILEGLRK
jgi:hypothetical protein